MIGGSRGKKSQADRLAVGIGAVELADCHSCIGNVVIGDKSGTRRASSAVEAESE